MFRNLIKMQIIGMDGNKLNTALLATGPNLMNISYLKPGNYLLVFRNKLGQQTVRKITVVR